MRKVFNCRTMAIIMALGLCTSAWAQERPPAMPTQDVVVSYKVDNTPPTVDTVAWLTAEGRIRTDGRSLISRVTHLIDTRVGEVIAVVDTDRTYHDLGKVAAAMLQDFTFIGGTNKLTKEGTDSVAGLECTVWKVEPEGESTPEDVRRACITLDGVPLRLVEGSGRDASTLYIATRVTYTPQDPARFRVPPGYQALSVSAPARRR